jgi:sugar phosphate isomerase/epimerase
MNMKLGCADFAFPLLQHDHVLELVAMLGFDGIDIGLFEDRSHLWPSQVFQDLEGSARRLRRKLANEGLIPIDIFLQTALDFISSASNHPEAKVREMSRDRFLRSLEFASLCGCSHVTALPGVYFDGQKHEDSLNRCREELGWRCTAAMSQGIVFAVEAHVGSIASTPQEALIMVRSVSGLTLSLDYTHFTKLGIPDREIEPLIAYASHFHARGAAPGRLQTPVKESTIDYRRVVRAMKETGYPGNIGIEYTYNEWENMNRTDNLSETILLRDLIRDELGKN